MPSGSTIVRVAKRCDVGRMAFFAGGYERLPMTWEMVILDDWSLIGITTRDLENLFQWNVLCQLSEPALSHCVVICD